MRRICHIVQSYYPHDPRIRRQAEALAEAGFDVDVICLRGPNEKPREVVNGVKAIRLPLSRQRGSSLRYLFEYGAFFLMASVALALRLTNKYHVIHVSNLPDFLVITALLPKLFGTKVVLDEHDPMPELFMSKFGVDENSKFIRFIRWQEKISVRFAHHVLTVNNAMRNHYLPVAGKIPVSVVMNLPDEKLFKPVDDYTCKTAQGSKFVLLYTGTVSGTYGLGMVIEAVSNLCERIPNIHLKIVGEGPDIPALRELAKRLHIEERVEFTGVVPFAQIPPIIAQSDIGISTLKLDVLTNMCFNNKSAEYVAMGLPAIVTRNPVVERHFPEGIVRFFEPGSVESFEQAVLDLHMNPELRKEMSAKGISFSKTANWSSEKTKYITLIDSLCGQHSS